MCVLYIYIYIYLYCICVYVCARVRTHVHWAIYQCASRSLYAFTHGPTNLPCTPALTSVMHTHIYIYISKCVHNAHTPRMCTHTTQCIYHNAPPMRTHTHTHTHTHTPTYLHTHIHIGPTNLLAMEFLSNCIIVIVFYTFFGHLYFSTV